MLGGFRSSAVLTCAAVLIAAILTGPAHAQSEPLAQVPYRISEGGWLVVPARVNGRGPYDFIVDTGATLTLVFQELADELGVASVEGPDRRILGLSSVDKLPPAPIGDVSVGALTLKDHVGVVLPDWPNREDMPKGVLGLDMLSRAVMLVDAERRLMTFYAPNAVPEGLTRRWRRARLTRADFGFGSRGLFISRGRVGNAEFDFLIDLGSTTSLINRIAFRRATKRPIELSVSPGRISPRAKVTDALADETDIFAARANSLRLGRARWSSPILLVYDAPLFKEFGVADRPFGIVGADLLRERTFLFDFPNARLYVKR